MTRAEQDRIRELEEQVESLRRQLGIRHTSDGREEHLGVTADRVAELRGLAKAAGPDALFGDALRDAVRFYDLVRKAWEGMREEYAELETQRDALRLELNTASAKVTRLERQRDEATLLLERAVKPMNRPELVREALEKLRG